MSKEIEHKYLVDRIALNSYLANHPPHNTKVIEQAYIGSSTAWSSRVRIVDNKTEAELTIKSATPELVRDEFTYSIPVNDAKAIYSKSHLKVGKNRLLITYEGRLWEVDLFHDDDLVLAETEKTHAKERIKIPPFCTENVTGVAAYYNENIAQRLFNKATMAVIENRA